MENEKSYRQKLRDLALYTEEQLIRWTEHQCQGEYLSLIEQGIVESIT